MLNTVFLAKFLNGQIDGVAHDPLFGQRAGRARWPGRRERERQVLAPNPRLALRERDLPQFPFTPIDPLIVAQRNPLDPVP